MSQNINQREMDAFLAWETRNRENGITTWTVVEGTPEEKTEAIFNSTAFSIHYMEVNPAVYHSVKVEGDSLSFVDPKDTVVDEDTGDEEPSGDRFTMTRKEVLEELTSIDPNTGLVELDSGEPEVQVCYSVTS